MHQSFGNPVRSPLRAMTLCALLASCGQGALLPAGSQPNTAPRPAIEATDASVFQQTDGALWDGRPSLGGVWVAHADVTSPERVEIRNQETGRIVQAALFRRERDFPGPAFQLSADAAVALGIPAGIPSEVTVTALRREPVAAPVGAEPEPETSVSEAVAEDPALAAADAAIKDAVAPDIGMVIEPSPEPQAPGSAGSLMFGARPQNTGLNAPVIETAGGETGLASPAAEDQTVLDGLGSAPPAVVRAEPEAKAGSAGSLPGNKPTMVDDSGEPIPLDGTSLQPITATEILAVPLPAAEAEIPAAAAESDVVAEPMGRVASDLERPFVQVASGSSKANADDLAAKLVAAGLPATVRETTQDGAPLYYVIVGPAQTQADLDTNLARVRGLGYPEAFIAKG